MTAPVLYSFRRCPYAMRARMALAVAGVEVEYREVDLKAKPAAMLAASPKGTVPVLVLDDQFVLDESLDIMRWALAERDPEGWLLPAPADQTALIRELDANFKNHLDRYKYSLRLEEARSLLHRAEGVKILQELDARLERGFLFRETRALCDVAIFPFVRQFRGVDEGWFDALPFNHLHGWLAQLTSSTLFCAVMEKHAVWRPD